MKYVVTPRDTTYKSNKEYVENDETEEATLYIFYTTWCPYCKDALSVIEDFKSSYKSVNNVKINYMEIDAEEHEEIANKYKVDSYPTIILEYNGKKILFDSNVKPKLLKKFLYTSLS